MSNFFLRIKVKRENSGIKSISLIKINSQDICNYET